MERIEELDGWRGIAILLVLVHHFQGVILGVERYRTGPHGVTAFFVVSGFLITGRLLDPDVSLKRFYLRRLFRLMPVAWSFLLVAGVVGYLVPAFHSTVPEFVSCLLFVRNFFDLGGRGITFHFWSLSIEEQFYFVWPLVLILLRPSKARWVAGAAALGCAFWVAVHLSSYSTIQAAVRTEVQAPALLLGCLLAMLTREDRHRRRFAVVSRFAFWPCLVYLAWQSVQPYPVPRLAECAAWAIVIGHSVYSGAAVLRVAPLAWIGKASYSIYVWNLLAFHLIAAGRGYVWFQCFAAALPLMSYYWIERPGIELGGRLLRRKDVLVATTL